MNKDILICGVGGQGTVLASKLLASAAMNHGEVVHSAETIGMAQRGGSVTSHLRIGKDAYAPLIPKGNADMIIAFEPAEAVRNLSYLKKDGIVIVSNEPVKPVTESLKDTGYDGTEMTSYIKSKCRHIIVDAKAMCEQIGSMKFFNVAILGVAVGTKELGFEKEMMIREIETGINPKFVSKNVEAFEVGLRITENNTY